MWLKLIASNWKAALLGTVIGFLAMYAFVQTQRLTATKAELAKKIVVIDSMRREAEAYDTRSQQTAKETSDAFTLLVEQIQDKDAALINAQRRFGKGCPAGRFSTTRIGVLPPADAGQADVPESPSGAPEPELVAVDKPFIDACAADAAFVGAVQGWRVANDLPISKE